MFPFNFIQTIDSQCHFAPALHNHFLCFSCEIPFLFNRKNSFFSLWFPQKNKTYFHSGINNVIYMKYCDHLHGSATKWFVVVCKSLFHLLFSNEFLSVILRTVGWKKHTLIIFLRTLATSNCASVQWFFSVLRIRPHKFYKYTYLRNVFL